MYDILLVVVYIKQHNKNVPQLIKVIKIVQRIAYAIDCMLFVLYKIINICHFFMSFDLKIMNI